MKGIFFIDHKYYGEHGLTRYGKIATGEFVPQETGGGVNCFGRTIERIFKNAKIYGDSKRPNCGWSYLFVGDMETGEVVGTGWKLNGYQPPAWFFDPLLRAMKLAEWKEQQKQLKKGKRNGRSKDIQPAV